MHHGRMLKLLHLGTLQDMFEDDSNIHMVMELCTGGSILEHLKGGQPLSEADVADISRCILRFIAQCHTKCAVNVSVLRRCLCQTILSVSHG